MHTGRKKSFLHHHSLSFATAAILSAWIVLYSHSDSKTHLGSFFGNASLIGPAFWSPFLPPSIFMRSDLPRVAGRLTVGFARSPNYSNGIR
jgi:hypothetical protein